MFLDLNIIGGLQKGLLEDCYAVLPELILCGTLILLLLLRLLSSLDNWHLGWETLTLTLVALIAAVMQWHRAEPASLTNELPYAAFPRDLFGGFASGLLRYDNLVLFFRVFLIGFTALTIVLSMLTGIPDREDSADFYTLLLGASIGMLLMAMANHLLMVFIAVEMASLPSFALAGFLKGKRQSSEAALKYVVYGGGASGIMLYGISLLAGKFGTGYLTDLGNVMPAAMAANPSDPIVLLGFLFVFIGLAFKLSVVPFHFWCPDVFEGAAAEVAGFLSVASKGAALALTARLALVLVGPVQMYFQDDAGRFLASYTAPMAMYLIYSLTFFAAITATFGNLAAYPQTNLKRLLAYSTIAHAGYMLMGLATLRSEGVSAVLFYLIVYLLMNLGAFACVAFLRNQTGSEDLSSFRGLIYRSPLLVIVFAFFLLSLLGLPPLAGFAAKFQIFQVLYDSAQLHALNASRWSMLSGQPGIPDTVYSQLAGHAASETNLSYALYGLLVVGGVNTVFSVVYYLKIMKVMVLDKPLDEVEGRAPQPFEVPALSALYGSVLAAAVLIVGILWNPLVVASNRGVAHFHRLEGGTAVPVARALAQPDAAEEVRIDE
jgi:NADH-quinone oxidoreductase subunit N